MLKKPFHKLARIRSLMIVSQLMLVGFMVYWLRSEYLGERDELKKDLAVQLERSQEQVTDSLIMATVLKPFDDTIGLPLKSGIERLMIRDSSSSRTVIIEPNLKNAPSFRSDTNEKKEKVIFFRGKIKSDSPSFLSGSDMSKEMIVRVMRSIINTRADLPNLPQEFSDHFLRTDTGLLAKAFLKDLNQSGMNVRIKWISSVQRPSSRVISLHSMATPGYNLVIGSYTPHIVKQVIPQFFFTIILLSLTALAFLVTYRSLRAQMHLAAIRNDLISNMSHELKTPVSTVKVALEAISEPEVLLDLPKAKDYIRMASLEMDRLELLINQALQSSLLENGQVHMLREPVNLRKLVEELVSAMLPRFTQQGAYVETAASGDDFLVSADRLLVQGVVVNILDNALKYAGPSPVIKIDVREEPGGVTIAISDNGPGIPEQYAGRIFDKFFRVPRGNEHSVKGYGLGLSYAAQVMKLHGGSITTQVTPGGGSSFRIQFNRSEG